MESQRLQTGVAGPGPFPFYLLPPIGYVSFRTGARAKEDIRGGRCLLQRVQRSHTAVLRTRFLREHRYDEVVESVHSDTMAGLHCRFRIGHDSRKR